MVELMQPVIADFTVDDMRDRRLLGFDRTDDTHRNPLAALRGNRSDGGFLDGAERPSKTTRGAPRPERAAFTK